MNRQPVHQLPLALRMRNASRLSNFIDNPDSNLLPLLARQRNGDEPLIYLHGLPGSGRTHLLLGQCNAAQDAGLQVAFLPASEHAQLHPSMLNGLEQLDLIAIDDIDRLAGQADWEQALFGLFNRVREQRKRLLVSATSPATSAGFALPDLCSRLAWGVTLAIPPLQEPQREQLLHELARQCGLSMPDEVAHYLIRRHARDNKSLQQLVQRLDHDSLAAQRPLSIPFVRERLKSDPG